MNDLRLKILANYKILGKSQSFKELQASAQSSSENDGFGNTRKRN